jgi:hypothetical protein
MSDPNNSSHEGEPTEQVTEDNENRGNASVPNTSPNPDEPTQPDDYDEDLAYFADMFKDDLSEDASSAEVRDERPSISPLDETAKIGACPAVTENEEYSVKQVSALPPAPSELSAEKAPQEGESSPPSSDDVEIPPALKATMAPHNVFYQQVGLDVIFKNIRGAYDVWDGLNQRTNHALYTLLALIYVACPRIIGDARFVLINHVRKHRDVVESTNWDPKKKPIIVLFLTMLLGLKSQRATKSQWKKLLLAAEDAGVERTVEAFVAWAVGIGGINGLYTNDDTDDDAGSDREDIKLERLQAVIRDLDLPDPTVASDVDEGEELEIPPPIGGEDYPEGFALVIVRRGRKGFSPLHTLTNNTLIINALKAWRWEIEECHRSGTAEQKERERAFDKKMNQLWREHLKKPKPNGYADKEEFVEERREEIQQLIDGGFRF